MYRRKTISLFMLIAITVCLSWGWQGVVGSVEAATFTDVKTWDPAWGITNSGTYIHELDDLNPPGVDLTYAKLTLEYSGNLGNANAETWVVTGEGTTLGPLPKNDSASVTDTVPFTLNSTILDEIMGNNSWSLTVYLYNDVTGTGKIELSESILSGTYTAVPIPASVLLLGSGVLGLIVIGRVRKTKQ